MECLAEFSAKISYGSRVFSCDVDIIVILAITCRYGVCIYIYIQKYTPRAQSSDQMEQSLLIACQLKKSVDERVYLDSIHIERVYTYIFLMHSFRFWSLYPFHSFIDIFRSSLLLFPHARSSLTIPYTPRI